MTEKEAVCHLVGTFMALSMMLDREMKPKDNEAIRIIINMANNQKKDYQRR